MSKNIIPLRKYSFYLFYVEEINSYYWVYYYYLLSMYITKENH